MTDWYTNDPNATVFAISTADELIGLAEIVNGTWGGLPRRDDFSGKVIRLTADIELSPYNNWTPIGDYSTHKNNVFSGTFDGGGHTISNLTIYRPDTDYQGLFGQIDSGRVENLELAGVNISGGDNVGGVAGCVWKSSIVNCCSAGTVRGVDNIGGLAGVVNYNSSMANCKSFAMVCGEKYVGGLAGDVFSESSITNCCFTGAVSGNKDVGDIAGITYDDCAVIDCKAQGSITTAEPPPAHFKAVFRVTVSPTDVWVGKGKTRQFAASVFGESADETVVWTVSGNLSNMTTISTDGLLSVAADEMAESLSIMATSTVNTIESDTITINVAEHGPDTRWYIDAVANDPNATVFAISTADELAGLAEIVNGTWGGVPERDYFKGKTIKLIADIDLSVYNNWTPIGIEIAGTRNNFSGTFDGNGHVIKNLIIDRPDADCQGLFGEINGDYTNSGGRVENLGLDGVNIRGYGYIGSLVGRIAVKGNVVNCYSAGTVSGYGYVGGLVGNAANKCGIINCYSAGAVSGNWNVGGLAGEAQNKSSIINGHSTSAVSGESHIGGVVGGLCNSYLLNCCSIGAVSGHDEIGGITGCVWYRGDVIDCAALNPHVKGTGASVGRVIGSIYNGEGETDPNYNESKILNNTANVQMTNNAGNTEWQRKGAENFDGKDVAARDINIDCTNNALFPDNLKTDPNHARALYSRGIAYNLIGEHDKAIADLTAVLKINPTDVETLFHRGEAFRKCNEYDKAIADLTAALKIRLDSAKILSRDDNDIISALWEACRNKGDYDRAIAKLSAILKLHPNHVRTLYCRGEAYCKKGELDKAIANFEAVLRVCPNYWPANYMLEEIRCGWIR